MISTVIFDLDGLLSDTERLHRRAYQEVLGRHGVTLTDAAYAEHWIRLGRGLAELLQEGTLPGHLLSDHFHIHCHYLLFSFPAVNSVRQQGLL